MAGEPGPGPRPLRRRRGLVFAGIAAGLAIAGVVLLLGKAAGYAKLLDHLRSADPQWLGVAVAGEALAFAGYVVALRETFRFERGPDLGLRSSAHLVFAGLGAARLLAAGGAGGIAMSYWGLTKAGAGKHEAAARLLAANTLIFGFFGAATWIAALSLLGETPGRAPLHLVLPWLLAVPAFLAGVIWFRAPAWHHRLPGRAGHWASTVLVDAAAGFAVVRRLLSAPRTAGVTLSAAALYWAGDALCLWAGLLAFDVRLDPGRLILAYSTGYLFTLLPLPLGGVGGVDAAMAVTVAAVGVPLAAAILGVLAYRVVNFWLPTPLGIVAFTTTERLGRRLEARARVRS